MKSSLSADSSEKPACIPEVALIVNKLARTWQMSTKVQQMMTIWIHAFLFYLFQVVKAQKVDLEANRRLMIGE